MKMRKLSTLLSAALAGALLWQTPALAQNPVRIGVIMPLSGAAAFDGQTHVDAAKAMADVINAEGGILGGRKLEIVPYDDKASAEESVSAARRAIENDKVDVLVTSMISTVALATKEITANRILHVVVSAQHPKITEEGHKWLFRINETNQMRAEKFSKYMCEKSGIKKLSIIANNDDSGRLELGIYPPLFEKCGITITGTDTFERSANDFAALATKVRSQRPDAVYVISSQTSQSAAIWTQLRQMGYQGRIVAGGNMNPRLVELAGPSAEKVLGVVMFVNTLDNPKSKAFVKRYEGEYKRAASHIEGMAAVAIEVVAKGMERAGSATDYDAISAAIKAQPVDTIRGPASFNKIGQADLTSFIVEVKDGKLYAVD